MASGTIAAAFAKGAVDYAVSIGVQRELLLEGARLTEAQIADPELRLPLGEYVLLLREARKLSGDPVFALHFGAAVDIREMSLPALIAQSMGTPVDALAAVNRYARLDADVDCDGPDRLQLVERDARLWLVDRRANPNASPELTESAFARMVAAARRVGFDRLLREVHFTHAAPPHRKEYGRFFGVAVRFGSNWNALAIDEQAIAQAIQLQPALAGRLLAERAEASLRMLDATRTNRGKVEALLATLVAERSASVAAVAGRLGMSRQTLYRRLREEGTSFERLFDDLRLRLAREHLSAGLPLGEIGYRLGFADGASFSKAFKRWTGSTPGRFRNLAGRGVRTPWRET